MSDVRELDPACILAKWKWLHGQGYELRVYGRFDGKGPRKFRFEKAERGSAWPSGDVYETEELAVLNAVLAPSEKEQS